MLYRHEATVDVKGSFPVDMLRYDRCYPASEEGAYAIAVSLTDVRRDSFCVTLRALSSSKTHWTPVRWRSFGATIVETTVSKL